MTIHKPAGEPILGVAAGPDVGVVVLSQYDLHLHDATGAFLSTLAAVRGQRIFSALAQDHCDSFYVSEMAQPDVDVGVIKAAPEWKDPGCFLDSHIGYPFQGDVEWLGTSGIAKGCNPPANDRFCPSEQLTRGQLAAFLVRALGLTDTLDGPFVDDDASIFETDIERLAAAGITKGCNPPDNDR